MVQRKRVKNPNSVEAINKRENGEIDNLPFKEIQWIENTQENTIIIDSEITSQPLTRLGEATRTSFKNTGHNKKLIKSIFTKEYIIHYYQSQDDNKWLIVKYPNIDNIVNDVPFITDCELDPNRIIGGEISNTIGITNSPRGQNWRNQNRSADQISKEKERVSKKIEFEREENDENVSIDDSETWTYSLKR